jgi:hypothetical protein
VYVVFLHPNGTARTEQKISSTQGNFRGALDDEDNFGFAVCGLGDLDGDKTADLAAVAFSDDDGGNDRGAVYVLFLHPNGTVTGGAEDIPNTGATSRASSTTATNLAWQSLLWVIPMGPLTSPSGLNGTTTADRTVVPCTCCSCTQTEQSRQNRRSQTRRATSRACLVRRRQLWWLSSGIG